MTSTTVADYAAAFQRHAASLVPAGHGLIDHDGLLGFAGTRARPDARLLVTDDKALSLLHEMLPSVSAGTIKVLDTAPGCRALLDQTHSWARESTTAMVCLDLNAVPVLAIPDGLTFHPVLRSPADGTIGIPLAHAAAAYLHAQADATATPPLDQFISYLGSLPDRVRLFAAVDESGVVEATSASEATDEDARVFFVSTHRFMPWSRNWHGHDRRCPPRRRLLRIPTGQPRVNPRRHGHLHATHLRASQRRQRLPPIR